MVPGNSATSKFNLSSLNYIVPRYGNFCGPGWTAGRSDLNISRKEIQEHPTAEIIDPLGEKVFSKLDQLCKDHDLAYFDAQKKSDESVLITQADLTLLKGLVTQLAYMTPEEQPYATLAIAAFACKLAYYDGYKNILGLMKLPISTFAAENLSEELGSFQIIDGEMLYSVQLNSDGSVSASRSDDEQMLAIRIDPKNNAIELKEQHTDGFGDVVQETRIHSDFDTAINTLTHSDGKQVHFDGVVVGKLTQEKLDTFADLGSAMAGPPGTTDQSSVEHKPAAQSAKAMLSALDVPVNGYAMDTLDDWFEQADALVLEPYRWEIVDQTLRNFWQKGTEDTLLAYDLGSALEEAGWDFGSGEWPAPDLHPVFSEGALPGSSSVPVPIFMPSQEIGTGWSPSFNTAGSMISGAGSPGQGNAFSSSSFGSPFNSYIDPLVVKLGSGSVHTTNVLGSNVMFDMNGDGKKERTGWITADQAFLVIDKNGNGRIDDIREMFSELTSPTASTGFEALAELDTHRNGIINARDSSFKQLRLWTDINANGETDHGELHTLETFDIVHFYVRGGIARHTYDNGNLIIRASDYLTATSQSIGFGEVAEVLFNYGEPVSAARVYITDHATAVRTDEGKVIEVLTHKTGQQVNATLSGVNVLVGGAGDVLTAGNGGQSVLIGNGQAILNGSTGDVRFIVNGSGNVVNTGTGSSWIDIQGDRNTVNAIRGDAVIDADGSHNQIKIGSGAQVNLGGAGNVVNAAAKSRDNEIVISGSHGVVNASNAMVHIESHSSVTLNGKNNDIAMAGDATLSGKASGGSLTVTGDGNIATITGAFIAVTEGADLMLKGGKQQVVLAGDATLVMLSSAKDSTINVFGDGNQLTASKATINLAEGAELDLTGSGSKITLAGEATLEVNGTGHAIDVYGTGNELQVDRSTIHRHGLSDLELSGTGNKLKVTKDNSPLVQKEAVVPARIEQVLQQAWDRYEHTVDQMLGDDLSLPASEQEEATVLVGISTVDATVPLVAMA